MKTYPVRQNITTTSQTFLYKSTEEESVRFRCTAYNSIGFTTQSKEFQIELLADGDTAGLNVTPVVVVCLGLIICTSLMLTKLTRGNMSSFCPVRGGDNSVYTDMSPGASDIYCKRIHVTNTANNPNKDVETHDYAMVSNAPVEITQSSSYVEMVDTEYSDEEYRNLHKMKVVKTSGETEQEDVDETNFAEFPQTYI